MPLKSCDKHEIGYQYVADTCPLCEAEKRSLITFEILYYNGGPDHAPNIVIGREFVNRRDLSAAIKLAGNRLAAGRGEAANAHGLYVHAVKPGSTGALVYTERTGREPNYLKRG